MTISPPEVDTEWLEEVLNSIALMCEVEIKPRERIACGEPAEWWVTRKCLRCKTVRRGAYCTHHKDVALQGTEKWGVQCGFCYQEGKREVPVVIDYAPIRSSGVA